MSDAFIAVRKASLLTGLCPQTLRTYADNGKVKSYTTASGHRRFEKESLLEMCNALKMKEADVPNRNFIYSRVSSKEREADLLRQIDFIKSKKTEYETYQEISEIASANNFKREGLSIILDACARKAIGEVVVTNKDRLSRFGFDLIKLVVNKAGGRIVVIKDDDPSSDQELSEDLLSIIHLYTSKEIGKKNRKEKPAKTDDV